MSTDPLRAPVPAPGPPPPPEGWTWGGLVRRLLLHARGLGASVEDAEDLVQETLEVTVRDPVWYDPDRGTLLGLLKAVLRHRLVDRHRAADVRERAAPALRLVASDPERADAVAWGRAAVERRRAFLAHLGPEERAVFGAWLRQRRGEVDVHGAAASVGLDAAAYEAAKKRLRRRCRALLDELGLEPADLLDGGGR
jgi:DNA-directed RNA polymerase specialized sigma24 family protein